jgi:ABC-type branched-subunit amino acid transport system ATPase component
VIVLARGRVLAEGAPDVVAREPRVIEAYLGV